MEWPRARLFDTASCKLKLIMNLFRLDHKVAVITGGGSGIGQAIAKSLASQGADVHILELKDENAAETVRAIRDAGGKAKAYTCNVAQQDQVLEVMAHIHGNTTGIDILVNSAGVSHVGTLEQTTEADLDRIYQVNINSHRVIQVLAICLIALTKKLLSITQLEPLFW